MASKAIKNGILLSLSSMEGVETFMVLVDINLAFLFPSNLVCGIPPSILEAQMDVSIPGLRASCSRVGGNSTTTRGAERGGESPLCE